VLFSCSNETNTNKENLNKEINGVVNPSDPDMHFFCPPIPYNPADRYNDPDTMYGKDYLIMNKTPYVIRVNMYILPKFATGIRIPTLMEKDYNYMIQKLLYKPDNCHYGILTPTFNPLSPGNDNGPLEIWNHIFGTYNPTGLIDIFY
jgi:hypothetical protein